MYVPSTSSISYILGDHSLITSFCSLFQNTHLIVIHFSCSSGIDLEWFQGPCVEILFHRVNYWDIAESL